MNTTTKPTVLVTGGAGYIGSHTSIELINAGYEVVIVDNLSNSSRAVIDRIEAITKVRPIFYIEDLCNKEALEKIFVSHSFDSVIHFAGLKSVGESVIDPLKYYDVNIVSTLNLLHTMQVHNVNKLIFSSSATVYGEPEETPVNETSEIGTSISNPYGKTKYFIEEILRDTSRSNPELNITILRYFNPVGAHESGLIGEDPSDTPNNLLPFISQVAIGRRKHLFIFGNDYPTPDGTGIRDYIHVTDLALGHLAALKKIDRGTRVYNLGTGKGTSVFELIHSFEKASKKKINYQILDRRTGDIAVCYSDPSLANSELNWRALRTVDEACIDAWRWQNNNPNGLQN